MINPPRREVLNTIEQAGGGERALEWILDGMLGRNLTDSAPVRNPDSLRKILEDRGFDTATIAAMVAAMPPTSSVTTRPPLPLTPTLKSEAERQAKQIALATFESRVTLADLRARAESSTLKNLYDVEYPNALAIAGLERVELIDRFPVLTAQFGFTRGPSAPGASRLRTYRDANGEYDIYGELAQTEALLIRLNPELVYEWLLRAGVTLGRATDKRSSTEAILLAMNDQNNQATRKVTELVHSYSHAFIKRAAVYAGIEKSALSEVILPMTLSFFVYATARGSFVLGGLQALLESELHQLLSGIVEDEYRCALDPGCEDTGAACAVCLHLGEPSCQMFNTQLSRKVLAGGLGYFDVTTSLSAN